MGNTRSLGILIFLLGCSLVNGQDVNNTIMNSVNTKPRELNITPSETSSQKDFDFLEGNWKVHNRKLRSRLSNSKDWDEFESEIHMRKTLNGMGNVENYYALFNGKPFEGMAVRLFNEQSRLWTIYWIDTNGAKMDEHPVTGSFENSVGKFYALDNYKGRDILVIYQWDHTKPKHPVWSQAFSVDNGKSWEWNWEMKLTKIK